MPYAAFHADTTVITKPTIEALRGLAGKRPPGITMFEYPFDSLEPLAAVTLARAIDSAWCKAG